MTKAIIDVGSNSVLCLVAQKTKTGWTSLAETSNVSGLGRGTKTTGLLNEEGMVSTLAAVSNGFKLAQELGATEILAATTMAARIATNTQEFLDRAAAQNTPIFVLSGDQEAELGFLAVVEDPLFSADETISIIDVGGHSTELVSATRTSSGWDTKFRKSFAIGALGLREGPLKPDSPDFRARLDAVSEIDDAIGLRFRPHTSGRAVTLGATGTNLVTIRERMSEWQPELVHGAWLDFEEVSKAVSWLCDLDDVGRSQVVGIEKGREHTLHAGALILERFLHALGVLGCTVSIRGWRHAMLDHWPM